MLETLVTPRIRRALLEYILTHPHERFYLRGLAKELGLSVSPLRRELKRFQHAGMLKAVQEANVLFYMVDTTSLPFLQLQQLGLPTATVAQSTRGQTEAPSFETMLGVRGSGLGIVAQSPQPRAHSLSWRSSLRTPALIGATAVGMALMLIMAGLFYVTMTEKRLASQVATRNTDVTVVVPPASAPASGAMHGARWQVVPGGFGGFSSGSHSSSESF